MRECRARCAMPKKNGAIAMEPTGEKYPSCMMQNFFFVLSANSYPDKVQYYFECKCYLLLVGNYVGHENRSTAERRPSIGSMQARKVYSSVNGATT